MQRSLSFLFASLQQVSTSKKILYILCGMLFFWALFDGVLGYLVPLVITDTGISKTMMGVIFGSSSIFGAGFDFFISKYFSNTNFRRIFLLMFAVCFIYPLSLWHAKSIWIFLIAMALWGLYYDLENFGNFDFIGTKIKSSEHTSYFGITTVFKSFAYLLSPLIAGLLISATVIGAAPFIFGWVVIAIAFIFFIFFLLSVKNTTDEIDSTNRRPVKLFRELYLWKTIGKLLLPVLLLTILLNIVDAFYWTIGPLFSESFASIHPFNGLFMTAYSLPPLLVGWIVGRITKRLGKKRTGFAFFFFGSLLLLPLFVVQNAIMLLLLILVSSFCFAVSWPSINGAYADYISESGKLEKEIEGLEDFSTNVGYTIGPMLAGFLADRVGNLQSFAILAIFGACISFGLFFFTPKSITVKV